MTDPLIFTSDNTGPVHPKVLAALAEANEGYALSYGGDAWTPRAVEAIRAAFEAPEAEIRFVPTGIAANALSLSCLVKPWGRVFCSDVAHVEMDESGAIGLASGGAEPAPAPASHGKMTAEGLEARILGEPPERWGAVSITQATERGTVYRPDEIAALAEVAHRHGLPVHLDGARWANAAAHLGCDLADMTWRAGVDAMSLGGTKNGLMGAEAVVFFRADLAEEVDVRMLRMGLALSKQRFLAAQMAAYFERGLWRTLAGAGNASAQALAEMLEGRNDVTRLHPVEANMLFVRFTRMLHRTLRDRGLHYALWDRPAPDLSDGADTDLLTARFVCDWSATPEKVDRLISLLG